MYCIRFSHPRIGSQFYFVRLKQTPNGLKPIGCWTLRDYRDRARNFETKRDADEIVRTLVSLGCNARVCKADF